MTKIVNKSHIYVNVKNLQLSQQPQKPVSVTETLEKAGVTINGLSMWQYKQSRILKTHHPHNKIWFESWVHYQFFCHIVNVRSASVNKRIKNVTHDGAFNGIKKFWPFYFFPLHINVGIRHAPKSASPFKKELLEN